MSVCDVFTLAPGTAGKLIWSRDVSSSILGGVAAGGSNAFAYTKNGIKQSSNGLQFKPVEFYVRAKSNCAHMSIEDFVNGNVNVAQMSISDHKILLVTSDHRVFAGKQHELVQLACLRSRGISYIASNKSVSFVISKTGDVYSWGDNSNGIACLLSNHAVSPKYSAVLSKLKISKISCGENHCLGLTGQGRLYSWGDNDCGQLGVGRSACKGPVLVMDKNCTAIACGYAHSMAICDNKLFTWGLNSHGQLGIGKLTHAECTPQQVPRSHGCFKIAAGSLFSIFLRDNVVFLAGRIPAGKNIFEKETYNGKDIQLSSMMDDPSEFFFKSSFHEYPRRILTNDPPYHSRGFVGPLDYEKAAGEIIDIVCGSTFAIFIAKSVILNVSPSSCLRKGGSIVTLSVTSLTGLGDIDPMVRIGKDKYVQAEICRRVVDEGPDALVVRFVFPDCLDETEQVVPIAFSTWKGYWTDNVQICLIDETFQIKDIAPISCRWSDECRLNITISGFPKDVPADSCSVEFFFTKKHQLVQAIDDSDAQRLIDEVVEISESDDVSKNLELMATYSIVVAAFKTANGLQCTAPGLPIIEQLMNLMDCHIRVSLDGGVHYFPETGLPFVFFDDFSIEKAFPTLVSGDAIISIESKGLGFRGFCGVFSSELDKKPFLQIPFETTFVLANVFENASSVFLRVSPNGLVWSESFVQIYSSKNINFQIQDSQLNSGEQIRVICKGLIGVPAQSDIMFQNESSEDNVVVSGSLEGETLSCEIPEFPQNYAATISVTFDGQVFVGSLKNVKFNEVKDKKK